MAVPLRSGPGSADPFVLPVTRRLPITIERGEGHRVFDAQGRSWLDCSGAAWIAHGHPRLAQAIAEQSRQLLSASSELGLGLRQRAAEALLRQAPENLGLVHFCHSGDDALDACLKMARAYRERDKIIVVYGGCHGRAYGPQSVTTQEPYGRQHQPRVPGTVVVRWGELAAIDRNLTAEAAAVLIEPIQTRHGVRAHDASFIEEVAHLCRTRAAVLIFNEHATAPGRTGAAFAARSMAATPHLIACSAGLAGGLSLGAALIDKRVAETVPEDAYGTDYAGNPLACAALLATLSVIEEEKLCDNARLQGERLRRELVSEVAAVQATSGLGLIIGVHLDRPAREAQLALLEEGILVKADGGERVLRLMPPLSLSDQEVSELIEAMKRAL